MFMRVFGEYAGLVIIISELINSSIRSEHLDSASPIIYSEALLAQLRRNETLFQVDGPTIDKA